MGFTRFISLMDASDNEIAVRPEMVSAIFHHESKDKGTCSILVDGQLFMVAENFEEVIKLVRDADTRTNWLGEQCPATE